MLLNTAHWTARLHELAAEARVPGATLGIWRDGHEVLAAHGVLNCATRVPVTGDSIFQVGSITKIWTSTMIMQLVDEGLLRRRLRGALHRRASRGGVHVSGGRGRCLRALPAGAACGRCLRAQTLISRTATHAT